MVTDWLPRPVKGCASGGHTEAYEIVIYGLCAFLCDGDVVGAGTRAEVSIAGDGVDIVLGTGEHLPGQLLQCGHVHGVKSPHLISEEDGLLRSGGIAASFCAWARSSLRSSLTVFCA